MEQITRKLFTTKALTAKAQPKNRIHHEEREEHEV
jgi:hypothetical protein